MKSGRNSKRRKRTLLGGVVLGSLSILTLGSVGLSAFVISGKTNQSVDVTSQVAEINYLNNQFYLNSAKGDDGSGINNLAYSSYGLLDDYTFGTVGHLKYNLIFKNSEYLKELNISNASIKFDFF